MIPNYSTRLKFRHRRIKGEPAYGFQERRTQNAPRRISQKGLLGCPNPAQRKKTYSFRSAPPAYFSRRIEGKNGRGFGIEQDGLGSEPVTLHVKIRQMEGYSTKRMARSGEKKEARVAENSPAVKL